MLPPSILVILHDCFSVAHCQPQPTDRYHRLVPSIQYPRRLRHPLHQDLHPPARHHRLRQACIPILSPNHPATSCDPHRQYHLRSRRLPTVATRIPFSLPLCSKASLRDQSSATHLPQPLRTQPLVLLRALAGQITPYQPLFSLPVLSLGRVLHSHLAVYVRSSALRRLPAP